MRTFNNPDTVHQPAATYSHHVVVEHERLMLSSGQIGMTPDGQLVEGVEAQLAVAFDNLTANLAAAEMSMTDVVKLTIYFASAIDPSVRRRLIADALGDHRPTMSVLYVAGLGTDEMLVEVEAIASQP